MHFADTHTHTHTCDVTTVKLDSSLLFHRAVADSPHAPPYSIIPADGKRIIIPGVSRKLQIERWSEAGKRSGHTGGGGGQRE